MIDDLQAFDPDKPISLPGKKCAYCGVALRRKIATRDHVVGRRFVPEGTLTSGFFLQVQSCRACNDSKAAVENDISLITMLPDASGRYAREDDRLRRAVERKSRGAVSATTRRLLAQSYNHIDARMPIGGNASLIYQGVAMPTLEAQRVARLAFFHVQGFFHFRSFDQHRSYGGWLDPTRFQVLREFRKSDWGNPQLMHFLTETEAWERTCVVMLADGYFRHVMRKKPNAALLSWALEWNEQLRVIGLYGDAEKRAQFVKGVPSLSPHIGHGDTTNGLFMCEDSPLAAENDRLFDFPEDFATRPTASPHWRQRRSSSSLD